MKACTEWVTLGKTVAGDRRMSDAKFGEALAPYSPTGVGFSQQHIAGSKSGKMSDNVAIALARLLRAHKVDVEVGELVLIARAEREQRPDVRAALMAYVGKVSALAASAAARARSSALEATKPARGGLRSLVAEREGFEPSSRKNP